MRFIDEYRDPAIVHGLVSHIEHTAKQLEQPVNLMEVCGSHTVAIGRHGIRGLLSANIRLISGPGCPVCVTSIHDVDRALYLADMENSIFATFGDMLRVPGTGGNNLQRLRAAGADIRVISSATDGLRLAETNRNKEVIFMGIGFETTSPTIAATVQAASRKGIANFSVFSVLKLVPPALKALIEDPTLRIDGFICPGHVSVITGVAAYTLIPEAGRAAVITGFEPVDIVEGILMILKQIQSNSMSVEIQYSRGVSPEGNARARKMIDKIFQPADAQWRGLGVIPGSGLIFRDDYASFDALEKFAIPDIQSEEVKGCACGDILRGASTPEECPMFRRVCTPLNPVGPCMVSSEGACAAWFKYNSMSLT